MSSGNLLEQSAQVVSDFKTLLNGAAVTVLQPKGAQGLAGWVFDIPTGETVDLESDITDHYTEDNSFVNDHIVNKPIRIMMSGLIGELVYRVPSGWLGSLRQISGRLAQLSALGGNYTPGFVQTAQGILGKAQAAANLINQYLNQAQNAARAIASLFGPQMTAQQKAFNQLSALWKAKTIFTVTTPWAYHPSMAIASMGFRQDQDSNDYSTITITLKEWRSASTKLTTYKGGDLTNPTGIQKTDSTAQGPAGTSNTTTLYDLNNSGALKGKLAGLGG